MAVLKRKIKIPLKGQARKYLNLRVKTRKANLAKRKIGEKIIKTAMASRKKRTGRAN